MKQLFIFLFSILLLGQGLASVKAQDATTDSLKRLVNTAPSDTDKVKAMISLGRNYFSSAPELAIKTCNDARTLAEKINYKRGIALALKNSGIGYYNQSKYVEALNDWELAKKISQEIGDKKMVANMLSNLGNIYRDQTDYQMAVDLYLQSLKIAEEIKDSVRTMTVLIGLGATYGEKNLSQISIKQLNTINKQCPMQKHLGNWMR